MIEKENCDNMICMKELWLRYFYIKKITTNKILRYHNIEKDNFKIFHYLCTEKVMIKLKFSKFNKYCTIGLFVTA